MKVASVDNPETLEFPSCKPGVCKNIAFACFACYRNYSKESRLISVFLLLCLPVCPAGSYTLRPCMSRAVHLQKSSNVDVDRCHRSLGDFALGFSLFHANLNVTSKADWA